MPRSISVLALLIALGCSVRAQNVPLTPADSVFFQRVFKGYTATCILYDDGNGSTMIWNEEEARKPYSPCSTFKIFNSMAALSAGVIKNEHDTIRWDGTKQHFKSWERDYDLRSAIEHSAVWYYQELASRIGEEQMQRYLDVTSYGNTDMSGGLTKFWLESSLKISAAEQIAFLRRIPQYSLPFSRRSVDILMDIMIKEKTLDYVLRGKTGSGMLDDNISQGWFVGWVEGGTRRIFFAVHIVGSGASGKVAEKMALEILK